MTDTPASSETSASGWRRALPVIVSLAILAMALHALSSQFTDHATARSGMPSVRWVPGRSR